MYELLNISTEQVTVRDRVCYLMAKQSNNEAKLSNKKIKLKEWNLEWLDGNIWDDFMNGVC